MRLHPLIPTRHDPIEVGAPDAREQLRALYRRADHSPGIRVNLISSIDGSAAGDDGTSESLSNRADRAVLGAIRAESDVVLIGAQSLRAEGHLVPRTARLAVLTASGNLDGAQVGDVTDPDRVMVLGPAAARARVKAGFAAPHRFIELPQGTGGQLSLTDAIHALRTHGCPRIVSEGGPSLASALIRAGLVGELCLTTSPRLTGAGLPVLGAVQHPSIDAKLIGLMADDGGSLYARWSLPTV